MTESLLAKGKASWLTRRKGLLLMALAPVIFILSGLFLMNTLMHPPESVPFQVGEVICFGVAPLLLLLGIVVFAKAPREKKDSAAKKAEEEKTVKKEQAPTNPTVLLARRIIGLVLGIAFWIPPIIEGPIMKGNWSFFLALFVLLPFLSAPYTAAFLYLLLGKRPRKIDALLIVLCILMLLSWYVAPPITAIVALLLVIALIYLFFTRGR